jgi:RNA polymerase primary sigma factor
MLNRKESKLSNGADKPGRVAQRPDPVKGRPRRRFIISAKAAGRTDSPPHSVQNGTNKGAAPVAKVLPGGKPGTPGVPPSPVDLAETIKTLLHLAQENGHITYDDINDILPDGLSPEDLDALYTKLRGLDVEIVDHAEVERAKPAEPEEEEDSRLEVLDDPVRMYMNQMGKVPLLTREQEVEICKRIEEAETEMKRLVYGLGFTAKEHIAIAEKLLSEPPKERFDRVVVDKKVANREGHLKDLRNLIKKVRALDADVDQKYLDWQKAPLKNREKLLSLSASSTSAFRTRFRSFFTNKKFSRT